LITDAFRRKMLGFAVATSAQFSSPALAVDLLWRFLPAGQAIARA
jgi:hypothetical protein